MKLKKGLKLRKLGGEYMVAPTGAAAKELHGVIRLNEVGAFLWDKLQKEQSEESLISAILDEYEIDTKTAESDVENFLKAIREAGLLA